MANPFYVAPIDPGWGRVGEALGQGISQGVAGFMHQRQLAEEKKRREAQEAEARARRAQELAALGGGHGEAPNTFGLRAERGAELAPVSAPGLSPDRITEAMTPRMAGVAPGGSGFAQFQAPQPGLAGMISRRTPYRDPGYIQLAEPSAAHPGEYIQNPQLRAELERERALAEAERLRAQRIGDALVAQAPGVGVDPSPYIAPDGTVDLPGLRGAIAAAYQTAIDARGVQASRPQAWEVAEAREQAVNQIVADLYSRFTSSGRPLLPEHRPAAHGVALGLVRLAGLPDSYVPLVVDRLFSIYGRSGASSGGVNVGALIGEAMGEFVKFLESPAGRIYNMRGAVADGAEAWLQGMGNVTIRSLAARSGVDPAVLRAEFERQLGVGGQ